MKKIITLAVALLVAVTTQAQLEAKYCMNYDDFLNNRWESVDALIKNESKQVLQLKESDHGFNVKTGDKNADAVLKKEALVLQYGGHLYVNSRNLRYKDRALGVSNYTQAYRYDQNKLLVVAYWVSGTGIALSLAADVAAIAAPNNLSVPAMIGSELVWVGTQQLNNHRCYLLDSEANEKGKTAVTMIDDEFMETLLADNQALLDRYMATSKKNTRLSAANVLPVLMEKGMIKDN